jgi:hypothetical protein
MLLLALGGGLHFDVLGKHLSALDIVGVAIAAVMLALLCGRALRNLRELARTEPAASRGG